jgi:hypothetical protein
LRVGTSTQWEEGARLSRLPRAVATRELCAMIAELASGAAPG